MFAKIWLTTVSQYSFDSLTDTKFKYNQCFEERSLKLCTPGEIITYRNIQNFLINKIQKLFTYIQQETHKMFQEQGGTSPSTKANALSAVMTYRKSSLEMGL